MRSIDELVAAHPFAAGLNDEHLALVAGCAHNVSLDTDTMLCVEGASADTFYLLRRGHVSIEVHQAGRGPIVIETVGPGDAVGWSWLVPRIAGRLTRAHSNRWALSPSTARVCARSLSRTRRSASPSCHE